MCDTNTSIHRGVYWETSRQKWHARLWDFNEKKCIECGRFSADKEIEAARAYDREAINRGFFGKLNFFNLAEMLENTSVAAVGAIANASIVGSGGASTSKPTSKFVGVNWYHTLNMWRARITVNQVRTSLGYFVEEEDAARAYGVAKRGIQNIPKDNNLIELLSFRTTDKANVDELQTVRPRYTSDELVQTTAFRTLLK
jgi:hypothetical protein